MSSPWLLAGHVISVVCWFSALFYLPRLFVYHADTQDAPGLARFKIMERRLYYGIMWPSAVLTSVTGVWLLFSHHAMYSHMNWMHVKLLMVFFLWAYHLLCGHYLRQFQVDRNTKTSVFYRWLNEVPTILLCTIMMMVFVRPF